MASKLQKLKKKVLTLSQKSLFRRSSWMLLAQGFTLCIQVIYFVLLARVLGSEDYGAYVSVAALTAIFGPFATWGSISILVKHISRDSSLFGIYWGNALLITVVFSFFITLLSAIALPTFLPVPSIIVFLIFISDLACLPIIHMSSAAFLALDQAKYAAQLRILLAASKLGAVLVLANIVPVNAITWSILYCLSNIIVGLIAILLSINILGKPSLSIPRMLAEFRQGFFFSISNSADFVNSNIDKTMLASMSSLQATGLYGASYRFLDLSWYAISAVTDSAYSKFFEHGSSGIRGSITFAKRLLPFLAMYGGLAGLGLILFSPFSPIILGDEFKASTELLRWFAPLPLLIVLQKLMGDVLSGSNNQGLRSAVQIFAAALNVILNLWLIPIYSWRGATWATLTSESIKLFLLAVVIVFIVKTTAKQRC